MLKEHAEENNYSKTCLKRPLKKKTKIGFQYRVSLNAGQKYCRMLQESILHYFQPSISNHLSSRPFLSIFEWPLKTGLTVCMVWFLESLLVLLRKRYWVYFVFWMSVFLVSSSRYRLTHWPVHLFFKGC